MSALITGPDVKMGDFPQSTTPTAVLEVVILDLTISDKSQQNRTIQLQNISSVIVDSANISAHAGGGQGSATTLANSYNRVTTVSSAGDSVIAVVPSDSRMQITTVVNAATNVLNVFPPIGGQFSNLGTNQPYALYPGGSLTFTYSGSGLQFDIN